MRQSSSQELQPPVKYTVIIERAQRNDAAWVPDLPGCVATADSETAVLAEIRAAISLHIESLKDHGEPVPQPTSTSAVVHVAATPTALSTHTRQPLRGVREAQ